MRSVGGTNCAPPCVVVACTKSTIAFFAAPSFHEGSGSACAETCTANNSKAAKARSFAPTPKRPDLIIVSTREMFSRKKEGSPCGLPVCRRCYTSKGDPTHEVLVSTGASPRHLFPHLREDLGQTV